MKKLFLWVCITILLGFAQTASAENISRDFRLYMPPVCDSCHDALQTNAPHYALQTGRISLLADRADNTVPYIELPVVSYIGVGSGEGKLNIAALSEVGSGWKLPE